MGNGPVGPPSAQGPSSAQGPPLAQGPSPRLWGFRKGMLACAITGFMATVILLSLGCYFLAVRHRGAILVVIVGAVGTLFWIVAVPLAWRMRKNAGA
jgi:hypothetical protein